MLLDLFTAMYGCLHQDRHGADPLKSEILWLLIAKRYLVISEVQFVRAHKPASVHAGTKNRKLMLYFSDLHC